MDRKQKIILGIVAIVMVLITVIGVTYAYFVTRINYTNGTATANIVTANIGVFYEDDDNVVTLENVLPGAVTYKSFTVNNDSLVPVPYSIILTTKLNATNCSDGISTSQEECTTYGGTWNTSNVIRLPEFVHSDLTDTLTSTCYVSSASQSTTNCFNGASYDNIKVELYRIEGTSLSQSQFLDVDWDDETFENYQTNYLVVPITTDDSDNLVSLEAPYNNSLTANANEIILNRKNGTVQESIEGKETSTSTTISNYYVLKVTYVNVNKNQNIENNASVSLKVDISANGTVSEGGSGTNEPEDTSILLADTIINNAKNAESGTDSTVYSASPVSNPAEVASGENERTLSEEPDDYTATTGNNSYYFRGNILDNYVDFAGMCWRVVRIEGDGSIKLILEDQDSTCAISNGNFSIGRGNFGYTEYESGALSNSTSTATNSSTKYIMDYLSGETNTSSSMATAFKTYQDTLNTKISNTYSGQTLSTMLKSGNWCLDDRGYSQSGSSGSYTYAELTSNQMLDYKVAGTYFYYGAYTRLVSGNANGYNPTLKCNVEPMTAFADSTLMYVGTLTADEIAYAGATSNSSNENFYLMNEYSTGNVAWWAFSPDLFSSPRDHTFELYSDGYLYYYYVNGSVGSFRPAVSLKSGAEIISGGDGTKTNAYVISVS